MVDYTDWVEYEGASEGSGRSDKIWLVNKDTKEVGLFKFTKSSETKEHISERLACDIAGLIGIKCARVEIGEFRSRIGCMSYLINKNDDILIEGIYLINKEYPYYNSETLYDSKNKEYYSLEMILNSIADYNLKLDFLKILIFDFLIGNSDRHQNNWAILQNEDSIRICPLYDNGSSLCCYITDENIKTYLGKDKVKFNSLVNTKSRSRIRIDCKAKKEPTHLEMIKYIQKKYSGKEFLLFIENIVEKIDEQNIDIMLGIYDSSILNDDRKKVIKKFLLAKLDMLYSVFLRKEEENVKY